MTEEDILQLARNVERAGVNLEVELGRTIVSLRDLVTLQVETSSCSISRSTSRY